MRRVSAFISIDDIHEHRVCSPIHGTNAFRKLGARARARCEKRCTNAGVEKGVDEINERRGRTRARERVEAETGGNRVAARGLERVH
mgnify:CR=1 FL=1